MPEAFFNSSTWSSIICTWLTFSGLRSAIATCYYTWFTFSSSHYFFVLSFWLWISISGSSNSFIKSNNLSYFWGWVVGWLFLGTVCPHLLPLGAICSIYNLFFCLVHFLLTVVEEMVYMLYQMWQILISGVNGASTPFILHLWKMNLLSVNVSEDREQAYIKSKFQGHICWME